MTLSTFIENAYSTLFNYLSKLQQLIVLVNTNATFNIRTLNDFR